MNWRCSILRNLIARYRRTPPEDLHSEESSFEAMHIWRVESWRSPPISCNSYAHLTYRMKNLKCMMKYGDWCDSACVHNIIEEIACRKTEQKYQVTIGLKFRTQSTKVLEERELQLNKMNAHIYRDPLED